MRLRSRFLPALVAALACAGASTGACRGERASERDAGGALPTTDSVAVAALFNRCIICHQADGSGLPGVYPPLAGSPILPGPPDVPIRIVMGGLEGPLTVGGIEYNGTMPPWGDGPPMTDGELAALLSWLRSSFGNNAPPVSVEDVRAQRAAAAGRTALWTPAELGIR